MKKFFTLTLALMATITLWAADSAMPTSGSYTNGTAKYELENTTSTVVNSKIYFAQRSTVSMSGDYGWRPYTTGFAVELSGATTITVNIKSNSTSARTITGQVYTITAPFMNIYKNSAVGQSLETYVQGVNSKAADARTAEEAAIHDVAAFAAITGSKDANKKLLVGENGEFSEAVKYGAAISHNCPTVKGNTNSFEITISAAGKYLIYLTSSGGSVGITSFSLAAAAPAVTHALEWDFAEGSCSATEGEDYTAEGQVAEGATITYPADNTMTKDGYDFNGWSTSETTMPTNDLTIIAQWVEHTSQSSDATLSALSVAGCTLSPAFAPATTAYTIALPFYASMPVVGDVTATKNDSYAQTPAVSISDNVITVACEAEDGTKKNYTITVNIAPVPTASSSINIEQLVLDNSKSYNIGSALDAANIAYVDKDALDSLVMGDSKNAKTDCNEPYLGLKFKKSTSKVTIIVPSGEALNVKFGAIADDSNLTVSVNGSAAAAPSLTNNVYTLAASEGAKEVVFALGADKKTVVFKQIMVGEDIAVVRPFLATVADTEHGTASVELAKYAKGEQVTVNCTPASGYQLDNIAVSGFASNGAATDVEVTDGKFTMPGSPVTITVTFSVATAIDNTEDEVKAVKYFKDGQLFIEKNGHVYNVFGACVK